MVSTGVLRFDDKATSIILARAAGTTSAALRLEIDRTGGRGGAYYTLRLSWTSRSKAERDEQLVYCAGPRGVPVFVTHRLWRYFLWHPLRVHGLRFGPIRRLVPEAGPCFIDDLREWEQTHPTVGVIGAPAA
jgi:hypothetical protein